MRAIAGGKAHGLPCRATLGAESDYLEQLAHLVFGDEFLHHDALLQRGAFHAVHQAAVEQKPPLALNRQLMERYRPLMREHYLKETPVFD